LLFELLDILYLALLIALLPVSTRLLFRSSDDWWGLGTLYVVLFSAFSNLLDEEKLATVSATTNSNRQDDERESQSVGVVDRIFSERGIEAYRLDLLRLAQAIDQDDHAIDKAPDATAAASDALDAAQSGLTQKAAIDANPAQQ